MKFDKPPLTIDQQVDLLASRGMDIADRQRVARYLTHINYYRLRAYWLLFEELDAQAHRFKPGTRFEHALSLYIFDRKFRLLVLEAIERVEISFRTRFAYVLGNKHGSHAHLDSDLFRSEPIYTQCLEGLREEFTRSKETFIEHYKERYDEPDLPPIWAACELMSFGRLSRWFQNLRHRQDRKDIASIFQIDEAVFGSFMHHLTHIRNLAAHHNRLWNRRLTLTMTIPRRLSEIVAWFNPSADRNIYNTLVMLGYLLNLMSPGTSWPERVKRLIEEYRIVNPTFMGFPFEWQKISFWCDKQ